VIRLTVALAALAASALHPPAFAREEPLAIKANDARLTWGKCPPIFATGCEIAILHGDPGKPNSDVFLRIAAGATLPAHWHSSAERMTLSRGQLSIPYAGGSPAVLQAGDYAFGPAKHVHSAQCVSAEPCTLFIAFEGPVDAQPASKAQ
jgi:quercetin dioxygenase-like cupin family protein